MKEVYEFLKKCETYYIATMDGDQPRVRPFGTVDIFEGRLYIHTNNFKNVYRQMQANPKIELSGMAGDKWIRVEATAVEDNGQEARRHMLDAYPGLENMYQTGDDNSRIFYLENATAAISAFGEKPRIIRF